MPPVIFGALIVIGVLGLLVVKPRRKKAGFYHFAQTSEEHHRLQQNKRNPDGHKYTNTRL